MFNFDAQELIPNDLITPRMTYAVTDMLALAWIFFAALATGLLMVAVDVVSVSLVVISIVLGTIWWGLSHIHRC